MAAGVRIQHPTERNCTFVMVDASRRYIEPYICGMCGTTHVFKTYHFRLDDVGAAIVSQEIAERLSRPAMRGHGFQIANEVAKPPVQRLVPGVILDRTPIVRHSEMKEPV